LKDEAKKIMDFLWHWNSSAAMRCTEFTFLKSFKRMSEHSCFSSITLHSEDWVGLVGRARLHKNVRVSQGIELGSCFSFLRERKSERERARERERNMRDAGDIFK
jgi:hypothetical protein